MSLDQNLFTLQVKPSQTDSKIVDLTDPAGNVFYRKQRVISGAVYAMRVYDFVSQSLLVTATAPSVTSKVKIIELQNPSVPVELKALGTFSVKWGFQWKGHEFEWKREEECYIIRKPDPPVLVVITSRKEIANLGRVQQSATIQVLDYNLNRFDIEDRKGLELVFLTSLLTFLNSADARNSTKEDERTGGLGGDKRKSTWTALSPFGGGGESKLASGSPEQVIPSPRSSPLQSVAQVSVSSGTTPIDGGQNSRLRTQSSLGPHPRHASSSSFNESPPPEHPATRHRNSTSMSAARGITILQPQEIPDSNSKPSPPTPPPTPPTVDSDLAHHYHPRPVQPERGSNSGSKQIHGNDGRGTRSTRRGAESGLNMIARMQALRTVVHETTVFEEGEIDDYAGFCWRLLKDEAISFITVRSGHSSQVQKVLEVVEATKRLRYQRGPYIELLQFVTYYPLPGGTTLQHRLEEKARLATMTPKDIKKMQKNKEKEEKKREAKAKAKAKKKEKGKGKEIDPPDNEGALELEQLQTPPKSVVVRLTKVEVQKMVTVVTPSSLSMTKLEVRVSNEDKGKTKVKADPTNKTDSVGQRKSTHSTQLAVAEDPRFLVQQAEIPRRYTAKELTHSTKTSNSDDRLNRRAVSGGVSPNHPHYRHRGGFVRSRNSVVPVTTTDSQFGDRSRLTVDQSRLVSRPSVSQPALGDPVSTSRPSMRPANRESVSYPGASVLKGSERISDLASSSLPPQLPPRRSQVALKSKSKSEVSDGAAGSSSMQAGPVKEGLMARLVAGPSRSWSDRNDGDGAQAPPSYDELLIENDFTADITEKLK